MKTCGKVRLEIIIKTNKIKLFTVKILELKKYKTHPNRIESIVNGKVFI